MVPVATLLNNYHRLQGQVDTMMETLLESLPAQEMQLELKRGRQHSLFQDVFYFNA